MYKKHAIILFDGVCKLCNSSINFILKRDKKKQFRFVALQSEKGKELIETFQIPTETDSVILIQNGKYFLASDAALAISKQLPAPWKYVVCFKVLPKQWRDGIYKWIAKNRYAWFGKKDSINICYLEHGTLENTAVSKFDDTDFSPPLK